MLRVFSQSLGCPKNLVDTEHVLGSLGDIVMVQNIEEAQLVFINTCAFIASAVEESIQTIVELLDDIDGGEKQFIVVCGCLVGRYGAEELIEELPEVDLWLDTETIDYWGALTAKGVQEYFNISLAPKEICIEFMLPQLEDNDEQKEKIESSANGLSSGDALVRPDTVAELRAALRAQASDEADDDVTDEADDDEDADDDTNTSPTQAPIIEEMSSKPTLVPPAGRLLSTGPSYAWLKIGEGCRHRCSFCTIPSIRGRHRSISSDFLVPEAKKLVDDGVKELILVAQDVTAWGTDLPEKDLRPLLDKLLVLDGLERLRLMYLYPAGMTKDLMKYLSEAGKTFVPYFDIPLQHAHPEILSKMGRPFSQNPEIVVNRIREYFPEAAIRTTFMVGFPGETEEHFEKLYNFVDRIRFQQMGVFAYEKEDGTEAARMPNQVAAVVKQNRRNELMQLQADISEEILESYAGQRLPILIDSAHPEWDGLYVGRTWFQAPVVDGVTYVSAPPEEAEIKVGSIIEADITETQQYDLVALV